MRAIKHAEILLVGLGISNHKNIHNIKLAKYLPHISIASNAIDFYVKNNPNHSYTGLFFPHYRTTPSIAGWTVGDRFLYDRVVVGVWGVDMIGGGNELSAKFPPTHMSRYGRR